MTWTKLSDTFTDAPTLLTVSRSARLLHVEALIYCNRHLTDGLLPMGALRRITDADDAEQEASELVGAGLWEEAESGWQVAWTDQESGDAVRERQEGNAERQKRYRQRTARHGRGDHRDCDPRYCEDAVTRNATRNVTGLVTTSRPDPTRPVPSRRDRDRDRGHDAPPQELRRPAHQRPHAPRILGVGEAGSADLTPWDFVLDHQTTASNHRVITVSTPYRADLQDLFLAVDCDRGVEWAVYELDALAEAYRSAMAEATGCETHRNDDPRPSLTLSAPEATADAWQGRLVRDLGDRLKTPVQDPSWGHGTASNHPDARRTTA